MGSVSSSLNPGVSSLLQTLSNVNSPILNSQSAVSAIENAPTSDIVQLSAEATQLQDVDALFGISAQSSSSSNGLDALFGLSTASTSSASNLLQELQNDGATVTPSEETAANQATTQSELTQALFGGGTNGSSGTLLNTTG